MIVMHNTFLLLCEMSRVSAQYPVVRPTLWRCREMARLFGRLATVTEVNWVTETLAASINQGLSRRSREWL